MFFIKRFSPINFFKKNCCIKCHNYNKINFAPSFKQISEKYKFNYKNKKYLYKIIKEGSYGIWGLFHMPSYKNLKKKNIYKIIKWILNINKN